MSCGLLSSPSHPGGPTGASYHSLQRKSILQGKVDALLDIRVRIVYNAPIPCKKPDHAFPLHLSRVLRERETGFIIRGTKHKPGCRCYACQVVRIRRREKLQREAMGWTCG